MPCPWLFFSLLQLLHAAVLNTNRSVYINTPQVFVSSQLSSAYTPNANIAPYNTGLLYNTYSSPYTNVINPYNNNIYPPYYPPNQPAPPPLPPPPSYLSYQQSLSYYNLTQVQLNILISNPAIPKPPPNIIPYTSQWVAYYAQYSPYPTFNASFYNNCNTGLLNQMQGNELTNVNAAANKAAFEKCMSCNPPVL
jgi:hypothetical protein